VPAVARFPISPSSLSDECHLVVNLYNFSVSEVMKIGALPAKLSDSAIHIVERGPVEIVIS
jgi:hypothetical protein